MSTVDINELLIGPRIREDFDAQMIEELACSIYRNGLYHAILVHDGSLGLELRAGETRLKAITLLNENGLQFEYDGEPIPLFQIPIAYINERNRASALEIEMEENLNRKDFTWQERVAGTAQLHTQYKELAEERGEKWTATQTAEEIARFEGKEYVNKKDLSDVSTAVILQEFLDDPIVAAAKDPKQALKMVKTQKQHEKRKRLAKEFDTTKVELETITFHKGDFFDLVLLEPDNTYDVILTDPPYGKDINSWVSWDGESHEYNDSEEYFNAILPVLAEQSYRIAKEQAHLYMFCDLPYFDRILAELTINGWRVWQYPLIWDKGNTGSFGDHSHGPRHCYDAIVYAIKGEKETTEMRRDILSYPQPTNTKHPAKKPVDLYIDLLERSVYPGARVIDFFVGEGTLYPAAKHLNCFATGYENSEKYQAMCLETINQLKEK
jgi:site-specific DNA-methyltransferase (adenine-specific)